MKDLDFPAHGVPAKLLDGLLEGRDLDVRDELPEDILPDLSDGTDE